MHFEAKTSSAKCVVPILEASNALLRERSDYARRSMKARCSLRHPLIRRLNSPAG